MTTGILPSSEPTSTDEGFALLEKQEEGVAAARCHCFHQVLQVVRRGSMVARWAEADGVTSATSVPWVSSASWAWTLVWVTAGSVVFLVVWAIVVDLADSTMGRGNPAGEDCPARHLAPNTSSSVSRTWDNGWNLPCATAGSRHTSMTEILHLQRP